MNAKLSIRQPKAYLIIAIITYVSFTASYSFYKNEFTPTNAVKAIEQQIESQTNTFENILNNSLLIKKIIRRDKIDDKDFNNFTKLSFQFYIVNNTTQQLIFWNTKFNDSLDYAHVTNKSFIQTKAGTVYLLKQQIVLKNETYTAIALLPITIITETNKESKKEIFTANSILHKYFKLTHNGKYVIKPKAAINGVAIEYIGLQQPIPYTNWHLVLLFVALLSLFTSLHLFTKNISKNGRFWYGFFILLSCILFFRLLLYFSNFPFIKSAIPIFDPTIYASNFIHPSLGDLLLNTFFISWIVGYLQHVPYPKATNKHTFIGKLIACFCLSMYTLWVFLSTSIIASLIKDSQISFNVLDFYSLNIYSLLATCCMSFICIIIARLGYVVVTCCRFYIVNYYLQFVVAFSFSGAYMLFFENENNYWYLNIVFVWMIVRLYTLSFLAAKKPLYKFSSKHILLGIVLYSISCALFVLAQTNTLEKKQRLNLAQRIALDNNNFIRDSVYTNEQQKNIVFSNNNYGFALYKNNILICQQGDVSFPTEMPFALKPTFEFNSGIDYLYYPISKQIGIVITTKNVIALTLLTLFNYIFIVFLFIAICFTIYYAILVKGKRLIFEIYASFQQIKTQLLVLLIVSGFGVFSLISLVMYNYFADDYNSRFQNKLLNTIAPIETILQDNILKKTDSLPLVIKESFLIYGLDGSLKFSSFQHQNPSFLQNKLPYTVFENLKNKKQNFVIDNWKNNSQNIGYIYKAYKDSNNHTIGFLAMPYPLAKAEQQQQISNFITTLLNIIILIFIAGFSIAFMFANRITNAFSIIANKMKLVSFSGTNQLISYQKNNEIKVLIDEYNNMVQKLNHSAIALAKSEREGAWKEMAKQVAHEIKNPLTPMKLSLQYLQKAIQNNQPNVTELANSLANTLTQQIDQLAKIASDFSQFANIHNSNLSQLNLSHVLNDVYSLFKHENNVSIYLKNEAKNTIIIADASQLNRLFTNLIKNAIEALVETENATIEIRVTNNTASTIIVSIADNGNGINEDDKEKIFTPNFTTKTSGTGLGLAICKGIVENANGNIWFANNNKGVSFFVEFPLVNSPLQ